MALHYIVDGYNVIKKTPFLNHKKLRDARDALSSFIYKYRPQGSYNNKVTVVFDGRDDVFGFKQNSDSTVIFSKNQSADDCIKALVDKASNPKTMVIVSDDKDIKLYCRPRGTRIFTVDDFIKKAQAKTKIVKTRQGETPEIGLSEQKKINEELSRIWLK